jgi:hypothetical protein
MDIVQVMKEAVDPISGFDTPGEEGNMLAYLLVLLGVASRYLAAPHVAWLNFSAEGASLLYFGARRSWREMFVPLAAFMATDYGLTVFHYGYAFHWQSYVTTWAWYAMAMALGWILLHAKTTFVRGVAAAILGPTSFFVVTNFSVWAGGNFYPHTLSGLVTCYVAAIPFYRNDLISASFFLAGAFAVESLLRKLREPQTGVALAGK